MQCVFRSLRLYHNAIFLPPIAKISFCIYALGGTGPLNWVAAYVTTTILEIPPDKLWLHQGRRRSIPALCGSNLQLLYLYEHVYSADTSVFRKDWLARHCALGDVANHLLERLYCMRRNMVYCWRIFINPPLHLSIYNTYNTNLVASRCELCIKPCKPWMSTFLSRRDSLPYSWQPRRNGIDQISIVAIFRKFH